MFHRRETCVLLSIAAALALAGAWASPAPAEIYIEASVGFPVSTSDSFFDDAQVGDPDFDVDFDSQTAFFGAIGIDGGLFRSELELGFRSTDVENFSIGGGGPTSGSGSFDTISLMSNLYLDVEIPTTGLSVWAGGGAGVVQFDGDVRSVATLDDADFGSAEYGFAYQLRAGITIDLTRNLSLNTGYRYWRAESIDFSSVSLEETEIQSVEVGLRLTF